MTTDMPLSLISYIDNTALTSLTGAMSSMTKYVCCALEWLREWLFV
jgi:hypothetical protein